MPPKAAEVKKRIQKRVPKIQWNCEDLISFNPVNPKVEGSQAFKRYEAYKGSKTVQEAWSKGASMLDLDTALAKGHLTRTVVKEEMSSSDVDSDVLAVAVGSPQLPLANSEFNALGAKSEGESCDVKSEPESVEGDPDLALEAARALVVGTGGDSESEPGDKRNFQSCGVQAEDTHSFRSCGVQAEDTRSFRSCGVQTTQTPMEEELSKLTHESFFWREKCYRAGLAKRGTWPPYGA